MIVIHVDWGLNRPYARAYWKRVDYRKRLPHVESEYACGRYPNNYPVPAIRVRDFEYWRYLGEVSALNNFDIEVVQRLNRYR